MPQFAALLRKDNQPVRYPGVDDSVFARKNIIKMVELFGGEIAGEAGDGLTAIAEFNRTKPDIVLMDITMPQMEGIEAVERIVRQHPEARIIMVSSVGYQETFWPLCKRAPSTLSRSRLSLKYCMKSCATSWATIRLRRALPSLWPGSTAHENGAHPA